MAALAERGQSGHGVHIGLLEARVLHLEKKGFDCILYQASQVKALPGRPKTGKRDSVWLAKITERGSVVGSFMPPEDIRGLRAHARYRRKQAQSRTAEKERCEKLLEDAHLKLVPDCEFFTEDHAFILQMMLDSIDSLTVRIAGLDAKIAVMCEPCERQIAQLDAVPGFGVTASQDLIAEIGTDMTVFPSAQHLCSWLRTAPGVKESAGKRKGKNATGRGNPYASGAPGETAASTGRTDTFLGAKYRRMCKRMPKKKAIGALMRTQAVIAYHLLSDPGAEYQELGPGYYEERLADTARRARYHIRSLERLGYHIQASPLEPLTGEIIMSAPR